MKFTLIGLIVWKNQTKQLPLCVIPPSTLNLNSDFLVRKWLNATYSNIAISFKVTQHQTVEQINNV